MICYIKYINIYKGYNKMETNYIKVVEEQQKIMLCEHCDKDVSIESVHCHKCNKCVEDYNLHSKTICNYFQKLKDSIICNSLHNFTYIYEKYNSQLTQDELHGLLIIIINNNRYEICKQLLLNNKNILINKLFYTTDKKYEFTLLMYALYNYSKYKTNFNLAMIITELLYYPNIDMDIINNNGNTALILACKLEIRYEKIDELIDHEPNPLCINKEGKTAYDYVSWFENYPTKTKLYNYIKYYKNLEKNTVILTTKPKTI